MRERVSGAVILLALAVIFLPMLFDDPVSRDERPQPMLSIEAPLEVERVAVDEPQPPSRLDETSNEASTQVERQQDSASSEAEAVKPNGNADKPVVDVPSVASDEQEETARETAEASEASQESAPQAQADASQPEQADPIADLARAAEEKRAATGEWSVQAGSFGEPGNAERLEEKLESQGFNAYRRPRGNDLTAVYVGPFASAEEGERARSELKAKANLQGLVVRMSP
ncbi:SPOR domain-containing protein [Onishia niordana]|uniref:SPOR domain-containing protein n=1 Tax=Onishia niordana TaxID=2508711 RepID=UPI001F0E1E8E|nr:SPOR domain-containing protein [Halomonas niordiana]